MKVQDLIITPIIILIVYFIAYLLRPYLTDKKNAYYFFPALTVKIIGAICVGLVYQFYYGGGDTFNFYTYGSNVIWRTFTENPVDGLRLILHSGDADLWKYTSQMLFYNDPHSFFVIRIAALFDLITFSTYSATAVLFAFSCFIGMWFMFRAFYELFPHLKKWLAISILFIPSVFFWGSGILKDTIVLGCIGMATYQIKKLFIDKQFSIVGVILLIISLIFSFEVKKYVLMCFLPAALLWIYSGNLSRVRPFVLRLMLIPFIFAAALLTGFFVIQKVSESDSRYALDKIAFTAKETAYDIGFYTGKNAGSGYTLGELDGSFGSMLKLAPRAINVSLFRPYLWEVRNPLMVLSALESLILLAFTIYLILTRMKSFFTSLHQPTILFCLVFSLTFAFAVGVSTYNFGTLARYKIPLLPFYSIALVLMADYSKRERKFEELESTE